MYRIRYYADRKECGKNGGDPVLYEMLTQRKILNSLIIDGASAGHNGPLKVFHGRKINSFLASSERYWWKQKIL